MEDLKERVKVVEQGRITIPKSIRDELKIPDGAILQVYSLGKDKIVLEILVR